MTDITIADEAVLTESLVVEGPGLISIDISDSVVAEDTLVRAGVVIPLLTAGVIPSGAAYVDLVDPDDDASTPALLNTLPADGQDDIPASDKDGAHPFHLTIVDPVGTGLDVAATRIELTVNKTDKTEANPPTPEPSVTLVGRRIEIVINDTVQAEDSLVVDSGNVKDIYIAEQPALVDTLVSGLNEVVYESGGFTPDWVASSEVDAVASDGTPPTDEMRFKLIRDRPFKSLERVTIEVHAEVL